MGKILKYKGAFYDLESMTEKDKELLKEEIQKQFPEPKQEKKEVKKKTSDE
jgi:hypothetical protein